MEVRGEEEAAELLRRQEEALNRQLEEASKQNLIKNIERQAEEA